MSHKIHPVSETLARVHPLRKKPFSRSEEIAHALGYRVNASGQVLNPGGKVLAPGDKGGGYLGFRIAGNRMCRVHRLMAYQMFGEAIYQDGIEVRHLDGNPRNNSAKNLALGTASENALDKPKMVRVRAAASSRRLNHAAILEYYSATKSYALTMRQFGLTSKGTLNFIIRRSLASAPSRPLVQSELL